MKGIQMRRFEKLLALLLGGVLLFAANTPLQAASKKDPAKEAVRRMQLELSQAQDQKAILEQDKASLSKELDTLKQKSDELASSVKSANRNKAVLTKETEALRQDKSKLSEEITRLKKELTDSQSAERDTRNNWQQETSHKQRLEQNLNVRGKALEVCESKNKMLYQYHVELIDRAQNRGSLSILLEKEPVLGFKRVQIENLLEEYRDKIDDQKVQTSVFPQAPGQ